MKTNILLILISMAIAAITSCTKLEDRINPFDTQGDYLVDTMQNIFMTYSVRNDTPFVQVHAGKFLTGLESNFSFEYTDYNNKKQTQTLTYASPTCELPAICLLSGSRRAGLTSVKASGYIDFKCDVSIAMPDSLFTCIDSLVFKETYSNPWVYINTSRIKWMKRDSKASLSITGYGGVPENAKLSFPSNIINLIGNYYGIYTDTISPFTFNISKNNPVRPEFEVSYYAKGLPKKDSIAFKIQKEGTPGQYAYTKYYGYGELSQSNKIVINNFLLQEDTLYKLSLLIRSTNPNPTSSPGTVIGSFKTLKSESKMLSQNSAIPMNTNYNSFVLGNVAYVYSFNTNISTWDTAYNKSMYAYNIDNDTWSQPAAQIPSEVMFLTAYTSDYALFRTNNKSFWKFDGTAWTKTTDYPFAFAKGAGRLNVLFNNSVYVAEHNTWNTFYKYNSDANSWSNIASITFGVNNPFVLNGNLFSITRTSIGSDWNIIMKYNANTNTWQQAGKPAPLAINNGVSTRFTDLALLINQNMTTRVFTYYVFDGESIICTSTIQPSFNIWDTSQFKIGNYMYFYGPQCFGKTKIDN